MALTPVTYLIVLPLVFLAAFVDAIAGGGGVISLPAYLLAGLPAHLAAGCNKLSACCGTITATYKYAKSGDVRWFPALSAGVAALLGAAAGAELAIHISDQTLKIIMLCALPLVAVVLTLRGKKLTVSAPRVMNNQKAALLGAVIGLVLGVYDGLIGPGTGTFMMLVFSAVLGYDLLTSSGCAKVGNLCSNIGSLVVYMLNGSVVYALALPAALCAVAGGYVGARFAVKGGSQKIKYVMFIVLALLFVKFAVDLIA